MNKITKMCLNLCIALIMSSTVAFGMAEDDERPNEHLCPIMQGVMRDPVVAADGHHYAPIPDVARGYEAIYEKFLNGKLIYRPNEENDIGKIELQIADLANPLEGEFDLSKCGDAGKYLSINIGYRKELRSENKNKVEIWFTPRFLVDRELPTIAENHHLRAITTGGHWDVARAPIGIFWTWGGWNSTDNMAYCDYLTAESLGDLGSKNLYKKHGKAGGVRQGGYVWGVDERERPSLPLTGTGRMFHISFVN